LDKKKVDLAGLIIILSAGLFLFLFFLNPLAQQQAVLSKKKEDLSQEIKRLRQEIQRDRMILSNQDLQTIPANITVLTRKEIQPFFLKYISRLARRHHVTVMNIRPGETEEKDLILKTHFDLALKGDFFNIYNLIRDIESSEKGIRIYKISIDRSDNNKVETHITLNIYAGNKEKLRT